MQQLVPLEQYASMVGKSSRTIYRQIEQGAHPDAVRDGRNGWLLPVDELTATQPPRAKLPKPNGNGNVVDIVRPATAVDLVGQLVELDVYAAELGTTVGGVKRMGAAGIIVVGKFGPRGSWRVFIPPRRS